MILEASVSVHIPAHRFSTIYRDFGMELHRLHGLRLNRFEVIKVAKRSRVETSRPLLIDRNSSTRQLNARVRTADHVYGQGIIHRFRNMAERHTNGGTGVSRLREGSLETRALALEAFGLLDCISPSRIMMHIITCISIQTMISTWVVVDPNALQSSFPRLIPNRKPELDLFLACQIPRSPCQGRMTSYLTEVSKVVAFTR